jgi:hypothetical protein
MLMNEPNNGSGACDLELRATAWKVIRFGLPLLLLLIGACALQYWLSGKVSDGMEWIILGWVLSIALMAVAIPATTTLALTPDGFAFRWLWHFHYFRWTELQPNGFGRTVRTALHIPLFTTVGMRFVAGSPHLTALRNLASTRSGFHFTFPNFFAVSDEELIAVLARYTAVFGEPASEPA